MVYTFLFFTLLCVFLEAFFSMSEMALVSLNKARLQYYVSKGSKRAKWITYLMDRPSRLFGTTLIGVNTALQLGSECSRRFYESIDINPDFAPITQVIIVLIFGELVPLFAARRHSEYFSMIFVPIIYLFSKILTPFIYAIDGLSHLVYKIVGKADTHSLFLSREELQHAFEDQSGKKSDQDLISNIFSVKKKKVSEIIIPIHLVQKFSSEIILKEVRHVLSVNYTPYIPLYHRDPDNIVSLLYPRDLLRAKESERVVGYSHPPWFITQDTPILQVLKQFRTNNQSIAVVLDQNGKATGIVTLDQVVGMFFGDIEKIPYQEDKSDVFVERTFSGDMPISLFNEQFDAQLGHEGAVSLSDLIIETLKRHPIKGEIIRIDRFEITVIEASLLEVKMVSIRTIVR